MWCCDMVRESQESAKQSQPLWRDLLVLTKPRITAMCVMMAAGGYGLAMTTTPVLAPNFWPLMFHLFLTLLGSYCVIAGSCVLNMYMERDRDKLMKRTSQRPLPTGRMQPRHALLFGLFLSVAGVGILLWINPLTAALAALALVSYVCVYTPMKTRTTLFLMVGTIPGAMPPLLGWTAVTHQVDWIGGSLYAIMVLWQLPHFLALSVMLKNDYALAGVQVAAVTQGERTVQVQSLLYSVLLLPVSLALIPLQAAGWLYAVVALASGFWLITIACRAVLDQHSPRWAPRLFFASLIYLPLLTLGLLIDQFL